MTKAEIKSAIRLGRAVPNVSNVLFAEAHEEVLREDHPDFSIKTLMESMSRSRTGPDGLRENIRRTSRR